MAGEEDVGDSAVGDSLPYRLAHERAIGLAPLVAVFVEDDQVVLDVGAGCGTNGHGPSMRQ